MRARLLAVAAAVLGVLAASSAAGPGDGIEVTRAVLRTRWDPFIHLDSWAQGDATADVDLAGRLPAGFSIPRGMTPAVYPPPGLPVDVLIHGRSIFEEGYDVTLSPTRRKGVLDLTPWTGTDWAPYGPWLRARLDLRRETFRFRTRFADHAVMEGDPAAVPLVVHLGDRTLQATVEFTAVDPDLWQVFPGEPGRIPRGAR